MKLHLALKSDYFDAIASGEKKEEYRLCTEYWRRRLEGQSFEGIVLMKGYPPKTDLKRIIERPWCGLTVKTITHPHFGPDPVQVYAIKVN